MENEARAAELLWDAWQNGTQLAGLPEDIRPRDSQQGMAVQARLEELAGPGYGWKIGATTAAGRAHIGVDQPFPGRLFERYRHDEGEPVPADSLMMAVAEPEFAFRMGRDLEPGVEHSMADVLAAVDSLVLALEMPDSRYTDYSTVGNAQLLADSACCSRFVAGRDVPGWQDLDLAKQPVSVSIDGVEFDRGSGELVMGDPRVALHWLALELPKLGRRLRAGDIVSTGTATKPVPVKAGSHVFADFGTLGTVEAHFVA
jgi:2-keto-4-pentenoate hydratase